MLSGHEDEEMEAKAKIKGKGVKRGRDNDVSAEPPSLLGVRVPEPPTD